VAIPGPGILVASRKSRPTRMTIAQCAERTREVGPSAQRVGEGRSPANMLISPCFPKCRRLKLADGKPFAGNSRWRPPCTRRASVCAMRRIQRKAPNGKWRSPGNCAIPLPGSIAGSRRPSRWTTPARCEAMSHAKFSVQRTDPVQPPSTIRSLRAICGCSISPQSIHGRRSFQTPIL